MPSAPRHYGLSAVGNVAGRQAGNRGAELAPQPGPQAAPQLGLPGSRHLVQLSLATSFPLTRNLASSFCWETPGSPLGYKFTFIVTFSPARGCHRATWGGGAR